MESIFQVGLLGIVLTGRFDRAIRFGTLSPSKQVNGVSVCTEHTTLSTEQIKRTSGAFNEEHEGKGDVACPRFGQTVVALASKKAAFVGLFPVVEGAVELDLSLLQKGKEMPSMCEPSMNHGV